MFWRIHKLVHELLSGHDGPAGRNWATMLDLLEASRKMDVMELSNRQKGDMAGSTLWYEAQEAYDCAV